MPNVEYSGSKGIVSSKGTGGFTLSGVGLALDSEAVTTTNNNTPELSSVGVSTVTAAGAHTVLIPDPTAVEGAAGQTKLVIKATDANTATLHDSSGAVLTSAVLNNTDDFALLVWTGTRWLPVLKNIT